MTLPMGLSIYIHIPYCLQRCRYCDFTTFEFNQILKPEAYVELLKSEIRNRHHGLPTHLVHTIYFGGGTPSLLEPRLIVDIVNELKSVGFHISEQTEMTLEINPATVNARNLDTYLEHGIRRMSVGAQTFDADLLKTCGRKHTREDTLETLRLLKERDVNYSFDLLFALPGQTLAQLKNDVQLALEFEPPHLSTYCLTVPEGHPMSTGRAPEAEQLEMFQVIESQLERGGLKKYEISNFARPGFESRHNLAYWQDRDYWGIGVSSHSYIKDSAYGVRFWNPKNLNTYEQQTQACLPGISPPYAFLPEDQKEHLQKHEALTDYCHISLRVRAGLDFSQFEDKFGSGSRAWLQPRLENLMVRGWVESTHKGIRLTADGEVVSNQVLSELTFLPDEMATLSG